MDLNIVTLNIPYPPDYGGMIDTFYRIVSLHKLGIKIHLHCFEYGRTHPEELESLCETVNYYQRKRYLDHLFAFLPYIVYSRKSKDLFDNLLNNNYPILFDGIHTTYYLTNSGLSHRLKFVRTHNIEHKYYYSLSENEPDFFRKIYFLSESIKLKLYERVLCKANRIFTISNTDQEYYNKKYGNSVQLNPSHPFGNSESLIGYGKYILFHGDLSVNENVKVSEFLISKVFSKVRYHCIIAGKNPSDQLLSKAARHSNIKVIGNPDINEMARLVHNAHINLLPALAPNGFKIKLLVALYAGRHCLVNSVVADSTPAGRLCHIANTGKEIIEKLNLLMQQEFTDEMRIDRQKHLPEDYNNLANAKILIEEIFADRKP